MRDPFPCHRIDANLDTTHTIRRDDRAEDVDFWDAQLERVEAFVFVFVDIDLISEKSFLFHGS